MCKRKKKKETQQTKSSLLSLSKSSFPSHQSKRRRANLLASLLLTF
jgi:hypothetical protein